MRQIGYCGSDGWTENITFLLKDIRVSHKDVILMKFKCDLEMNNDYIADGSLLRISFY